MALNQRTAILDHLMEHGSITPIDALMQFGCFRIAARIHELRLQGHDIRTDHETDDHGKTYARYRYACQPQQQHLSFT